MATLHKGDNDVIIIIIIIIITIHLVIPLCEGVTPRLPCLPGTDYDHSKVRYEAEETVEHLSNNA